MTVTTNWNGIVSTTFVRVTGDEFGSAPDATFANVGRLFA
jgi:hypothetical protein